MITVNINKAKSITHNKRRAARTEEFKPLDIEVTIPMFSEQAEQKRQEIREKYAAIQTQIDEANSVDVLKSIITQL